MGALFVIRLVHRFVTPPRGRRDKSDNLIRQRTVGSLAINDYHCRGCPQNRRPRHFVLSALTVVSQTERFPAASGANRQ